MGAIERLLKPGSLLSYFEYYGIRRLRMALGRKGEKLNKLTEMDDYLVGRERQLGETSEMVWWNLLPAMCRRLRMPAND
jgi:hypothetical protein